MYVGETVLNFQPNWLDVSQMEPGGRVLYFHPEKLCLGLGKHELGLNLLVQKLILWKKNSLIKNKKLGDIFSECGLALYKLCDHGHHSRAECPDSPQR